MSKSADNDVEHLKSDDVVRPPGRLVRNGLSSTGMRD